MGPGERAPAERARLTRRGFWLEYASMAWMTVEAAVAIAAGVIASSIALVGFGLDSVIGFAAAAVVAWQLRGESEDRERRAVRLIGVTFVALAGYLAVESINDLISQARPGQSPAGIAVTSAALLVMPSLAVAEHRTGHGPGQPDAHRRRRRKRLLRRHFRSRAPCPRTQRLASWWRADPAAALVIAALAAKEGLQAREEN